MMLLLFPNLLRVLKKLGISALLALFAGSDRFWPEGKKEILPVISVTRRICVFERTGDRPLAPGCPPAGPAMLRTLCVLLAHGFDPHPSSIKRKRHLFQGAFVFERTGDRTLSVFLSKSLFLLICYNTTSYM